MIRSIPATALSLTLTFAGAAAEDGAPSRNLDDIAFQRGGPSISTAPAWRDAEKEVYGMYVKIDAGGVVPHHTHTFGYYGVTLQGTWVHYYGDDLENGHEMPLGAHAFQPGQEVHADGCAGPEDCILYIVLLGQPDNIPYVKE